MDKTSVANKTNYSALNNVSVILIGTNDSANIGATARGMSNFGLEDLRLVNCAEHKSQRAYALACSGSYILDNAKTYKSLKDALVDKTNVIGFTRRTGKQRASKKWEDLSKSVYSRALKGEATALVFGREDDGLSNNEIHLCHDVSIISTNSKSPSLNLAQAVTLSSYILSLNVEFSKNMPHTFMATAENIHELINLSEAALIDMGYDDAELRNNILERWKGILGRAGLEVADARMIKALLNKTSD